MLKRISAVLLAIAMMLTMACTISIASAEENVANLIVTADNESVKRGDKVVFTVAVETTEIKLSGLAIDVVADDALVFESKEAIYTKEMPHQAEGTAFVWATGDGELNFDGAICTYTFAVKEDADLEEAGITVSATHASYDTANDTVDCPELVGDGVKNVAIECKHAYENGAWNKPADGTAKADAKHYKTCDFDDCDAPFYEACQFSQTNVTTHTQDQPGEITWTCSVCGYECTTEIPAGHEKVIRYKAADVAGGIDGYWEEYCAICDEYDESYVSAKTPIAAQHPNKDVNKPKSQWYYTHVSYVVAAGLMTGGSNVAFRPSDNITRGELAVVLANLYYGAGNVPAYNPNGKQFSDTKNYWGKQFVQAIAEAGLTSGYDNGNGTYSFKPEQNITTTEIIIMFKALCEKKGLADYQFNPAVRYSDRNTAESWAYSFIDWAGSTGFMTGDAQGRLFPKANYTRDKIAVLLYNFDKAYRGVVIL